MAGGAARLARGLAWPALQYQCGPALRRAAAARGARWVQLGPDAATEHFLETCELAGPLKLAAHQVLRSFVSHYDAVAMLKMYPLHLLSADQLDALLQAAGAEPGRRFKAALDIGGGDGTMASALLSPRADAVLITETSKRMAKLATAQGALRAANVDLSADAYRANPPRELSALGRPDLALMLNVLDRTNRPQTLLERLARFMAPEGLAIIASPLPFRGAYFEGPFIRRQAEKVEFSDFLAASALGAHVQGQDEEPSEWDRQAAWMLDHVLSTDFDVLSFARVPYISAGDVTEPFVIYDDIVAVCRPKPVP